MCILGKRRHPSLTIVLCVATAFLPLAAQSNRAMLLSAGGVWHLHAHIPLGSDALLLEPAHHTIQMLASVECPQFEGWSLASRNDEPILLDAAGKAVKQLPQSVVFRVTVLKGAAKSNSENPIPLEYSNPTNQLLLDVHFRVQIFRGMRMLEIAPKRTWLIGVPASEDSDERIYRTSFDWGDVRPDDRIVLLVTDGEGTRLTKFHLEFL
jgi:hypothetical protein